MPRFGLPLLLLAVLTLAPGCQRAEPPVSEPPASGAPLSVRVMSFNIRYGTAKDGEDHWDKRQDFVIDTIRAYNPDLLGTQEVLADQADFLQQRLPEYGFAGGGRDDGKRQGEYSPIRSASSLRSRSKSWARRFSQWLSPSLAVP